MLEVLKTLAEQLASGKIDQTEARKQAHQLSPKYAATFEIFVNLGLPALALLIAMIGAYLQYEGNKSSSEDAKKILAAITEQTFLMKDIKDKYGIKNDGDAPTGKKPNEKAMSAKGPSSRRANVNRERRHALKNLREALGKSRTR
jgi:hypothetical protein